MGDEPLSRFLVNAINTVTWKVDAGPDPRLAWRRVRDHLQEQAKKAHLVDATGAGGAGVRG
jgi:hypothetical protein